MQSCSVLLPSQIHMTKFTPHLGYFFQFNQRCGKNEDLHNIYTTCGENSDLHHAVVKIQIYTTFTPRYGEKPDSHHVVVEIQIYTTFTCGENSDLHHTVVKILICKHNIYTTLWWKHNIYTTLWWKFRFTPRHGENTTFTPLQIFTFSPCL